MFPRQENQDKWLLLIFRLVIEPDQTQPLTVCLYELVRKFWEKQLTAIRRGNFPTQWIMKTGEVFVLYSLTWFCSAWRCHCPWRTARSRSSLTRSLWSGRHRARFVRVRVSFPPPVAWFCQNTTWDRRNEESQSICNKLQEINTQVEDTKDWNLSNIHPLIGFKLRNIYHHLAIAHLWTWRFEIFMRLVQKKHILIIRSRLCFKYPSMSGCSS